MNLQNPQNIPVTAVLNYLDFLLYVPSLVQNRIRLDLLATALNGHALFH